jgi:AAA+ ATPase superfamily predicted ATPase
VVLRFVKRYTALVEAQQNPFVYGRPISREEDLANREEEKRVLMADVLSEQPVMMHAPRRYGKTSLVRVVARKLLEENEMPFVYADLWGVRSITDLVEVLGEAYSKASGLLRARRSLAELLRSIGFEVSVSGILSVRYEPRGREDSGRGALRELLRVPQRMAERSPSGKLLLVLDEFGELNDVPEEPDALMRSAFQDSPDVSFIFLGSKRSLMDALFSDRRRPFYNFGRRTTLGRLAYDELGEFVEEKFEGASGQITSGAVDLLLDLTGGHPHRAQQIAFHAFHIAAGGATVDWGGVAEQDTVLAAKERALDETAEEFRAVLDGMPPSHRALYVALCKEPTAELHSRVYHKRHGIRGSGSVRSALRALVDGGELDDSTNAPSPTDPLFAAWVRERMGRSS